MKAWLISSVAATALVIAPVGAQAATPASQNSANTTSTTWSNTVSSSTGKSGATQRPFRDAV